MGGLVECDMLLYGDVC